MQRYEYCFEVLMGEPFLEKTDGDAILPPPMMKQLRGRPKKQTRGGWEAVVKDGKGKFTSMTRLGRVMHCVLCRERAHDKGNYPNTPEGYVEQANI